MESTILRVGERETDTQSAGERKTETEIETETQRHRKRDRESKRKREAETLRYKAGIINKMIQEKYKRREGKTDRER